MVPKPTVQCNIYIMFTYLDTVNKYYPANKITARDENNISFDFWRGGSSGTSNHCADTVGQIFKSSFIFFIAIFDKLCDVRPQLIIWAVQKWPMSFLDETPKRPWKFDKYVCKNRHYSKSGTLCGREVWLVSKSDAIISNISDKLQSKRCNQLCSRD